MNKGALFIVATPIGNLQDLSFRARDTLANVDLIACEDTRRTSKLLSGLNSQARLISFHKFSEAKKEEAVLEVLEAGEDVALVSDAGTPAISDPGHRLVAAARSRGYRVTVIPGPSAIVSAIAVSGFDGSQFTFMGYVPRKPGEREALFGEIRNCSRTVALFEAPKRLIKFLEEARELIPEREMVIVRELTKIHEEILKGKPAALLDTLANRDSIKGEIVIVIEAAAKAELGGDPDGLISVLIEEGYSGKKLADEAKRRFGISKGAAYQRYLELRDRIAE